MAISAVGSNAVYAAGLLAGGASGRKAAGAAGAAQPPADDSNNAFQYLINYLKESPAKRMEDAWLASHHLSEQALAAMPPAQQDAIRKQMADDIKRKLQEQSGGAGANANVVV